MEKLFKLFFLVFSLSFGISLQEAEELALKNFYDIKKKEEEVKKSQEEIYATLSELFPQVDLSYSFLFAKEQEVSVNTPFFSTGFTLTDDNFYRLNFLITQNLVNLTTLNKLKVAKTQKELKIKELELAKNAVRYKVREAYVNALKLKATVEVLEKQVKRLEEHYRNVEFLYKEGYVAFKDLLETKVKLYEAKNNLLQARANYEKSLDVLSFFTGKEVKEIEEIYEIPEVESIDLSDSPKLKVLKTAIKLSQDYVSLASSLFYPVVDFSVLYQRTNESPSLPKDRYFISLNLKWNLFSGGRRLFELRKAQKDVEVARLEYLKEEELLKTTVKGILRDIKVLQEEIETAKLRVKEAEEHYRLAVEKYKNGLGNNAEVLDAEAYLTSAEQELKVKTYDLILAKFKLLEVVGR